MAGYIPDEVLEEIRSRVDIVDLISEYVVLKKTGRNYTGLCPFHSEKTPSFTVSFEKQMFYCFGCGAGGNLFTFLMRVESLEFPEAARMLAERLGIPETALDTGKPDTRKTEKDRLYQLTELAVKYYSQILWKEPAGAAALKYLQTRGVSEDCIRSFQLGYSPHQPDGFYQTAIRKGYTAIELVKAGLAQKGYDGRYHDRFRGRLMFPIFDTRGKAVGFGGRVLDESQPKYLNSPETIIFQKGRQLYGLFQGRRQIRDEDRAVVVEGYLDVIISHQYGVTNTVAPLGTALGKEQIKGLFRYSQNITVAFDSDPAGVAATLRNIELLHEIGGQVAVASLPEGKDPDEYLRKNGIDRYRSEVLQRAVPIVEYKLDHAIRRTDTKTIAGKVQVVNEILPVISIIGNYIDRDEQVKLVARKLGLEETAIRSELAKYLGKMRKTGTERDRNNKLRDNSNRDFFTASKTGRGLGEARQNLEHPLLWLMIEDPNILTKVLDELGADFFHDPDLGRIIKKAAELKDRGLRVDPVLLADHLDTEAVPKMTAIFIEDTGFREKFWPDRDRAVTDFLAQIKKEQIEQERDSLSRSLEDSYKAGDLELARDLSQKVNQLNTMLKKGKLSTSGRREES